MKRYYTIIASFLLSFLAVRAMAQVDDGTFRALTHTASARDVALGGIMLPMHDGDLQTVLFNPSAISPDMHNQMALSYVGDFSMGTHYAAAQYSRTFEKLGSFAVSAQYYNYGTMQYADEGGHTDGTTFTPSDYALTLGWGRELTDKWSIGANLKYAGYQYESGVGGALGVDVAGTYWAYSDWAFTLGLRNFGRQLFNNTDAKNDWLPFSIDFTSSKKLAHLPLTIIMGYHDIQKWKLVSDEHYLIEKNYDPITGEYSEPKNTVKFFNNLGAHLVLGGELAIGKNLILRAAYNYDTHLKMDVPQARTLVGLSAGFGIKIKAFQIDYALTRSNIATWPQFLTLRMDMSKLK